MTKYADRLFCRCQHTAADHVGQYPHTSSACMKTVSMDNLGKVSWCQCHEFKLDNLKYLEEQYESRKRSTSIKN